MAIKRNCKHSAPESGLAGRTQEREEKKKCCLWRFIVLYGARVLMIFSNSYLVVAEKYVYK